MRPTPGYLQFPQPNVTCDLVVHSRFTASSASRASVALLPCERVNLSGISNLRLVGMFLPNNLLPKAEQKSLAARSFTRNIFCS